MLIKIVLSLYGPQFVLSYAGLSLRPDFMSSNDEGHFAAPRVDETRPAGVQCDVISILAAQTHRRVFKRRLTCILQHYT